MRLFDTNGADSAYDKSFNPPDYHEICECFNCHEAGCHDGEMEDFAAPMVKMVMGHKVIEPGCAVCFEAMQEMEAKALLQEKEN